jgi:hypothetical protein
VETKQTNEEKVMKEKKTAVGVALFALTLLLAPVAVAQEETKPKPEVLVGDVENGYFFALDNKFSEIDGRFANFFGVYGGWLINHKLLLGVGGYGRTTDVTWSQMGYGGFVMEYFINPNRLMNFSVKGLVGGGGSSHLWTDSFFVAEPEAKMSLNVTDWFRLSAGGGYRFVRASHRNDALSGWTISLAAKFGSF